MPLAKSICPSRYYHKPAANLVATALKFVFNTNFLMLKINPVKLFRIFIEQ
jgi:hypothetical protein